VFTILNTSIVNYILDSGGEWRVCRVRSGPVYGLLRLDDIKSDTKTVPKQRGAIYGDRIHIGELKGWNGKSGF
jgi:hypothetical protein